MANFCSRCGKPLADGETCSCSGQASKEYMASVTGLVDSAKGFWETMKNRMGIGDPDLNKGDAFENNKSIIPDCVKANEGEIPVKQYKVATLRNRILGIPYTKAVGRVQVTNKGDFDTDYTVLRFEYIPHKNLCGFKKIYLKKGDSIIIDF
jgi:hypothetical protein